MSNFFYRNLKKNYPTVKEARGVWITDTDGRKYLDGCSGAIVANLGHNLTEINQAISRQLEQFAFAHTSQFVSQCGLDLAEQLVNLTTPAFGRGARVYFTSGGSESVETAMKMARAYFVHNKDFERSLCLSRWHGYHGSTLGALSVTGHPARRKPYIPLLRPATHVNTDYKYRCKCGFGPGPCPSEQCVLQRANELEDAILLYGPENVMAFIGEPIVGATLGAAVPGNSYWPRIREICSKYGVLLIADEVMTGLGRTGANYAMDWWGVQPDIIALGKGLSAGYMPLGAVVASEKVVDCFQKRNGHFEHGFTYSGHPLSCAAGLAAITYLSEHALVERVAGRESEFFSGLRELAQFEFVGDIRGRGFMAGIELVRDQRTKEPFAAELNVSQVVTREAAENGLLVYPGSAFIDGIRGDHFMVAPPLTTTDAEFEELFRRLNNTLKGAREKTLALS